MDLRDKKGKIIGRIMDSGNGNQRLYNSIGTYIGYYDSGTDSTYNKYGGYYGSGNLLTLLITEP